MTEYHHDNAFTHAMQILNDEGFGSIAELHDNSHK
jgi:hypothetical protein